MKELANRIVESNFVWLNTNMREIDTVLGVKTTPHDVVAVTHNGTTKKVALLGLLTEDPSVYRPGSFGGATIEPVIESCERYLQESLDPSSVDLIIPLTHQRMPRDRAFSEKFGSLFPVNIAGHDHEPFDEVCNGSRIVKVGIDAENTAIIDICWSLSDQSQSPAIQVEMVPTTTFEANPAITERVRCHRRILEELEKAKLFRFDEWLPKHSSVDGVLFSTEDNRLGPSNGTTILCSILRMGMRCQCALITFPHVS